MFFPIYYICMQIFYQIYCVQFQWIASRHYALSTQSPDYLLCSRHYALSTQTRLTTCYALIIIHFPQMQGIAGSQVTLCGEWTEYISRVWFFICASCKQLGFVFGGEGVGGGDEGVGGWGEGKASCELTTI